MGILCSVNPGVIVADKSSPSIIPIVLFGGAAYLGYKLFFAPATSAAQASATSATPATNPPATAQPTTTPPASAGAPQSSYNSLDATFARLNAQVAANANDPAVTSQQGTYIATPSVFNYYLAQVSSYALDSTGMAAAFPGGDKPMSLGAFWSAASQYLAQAKGLSGIAGGRGMAGYILSRRRA